MKKVKQTLRHLVFKKSDTRRAYFTFKIPVCVCLEPLTRLRALNSLSEKNRNRLVHLIAKIPRKCSNVRTTTNSPWPNFALKIPTFRTLLRTYLWQRQHDVECEPSIISSSIIRSICPHSCQGNFLSTAGGITANCILSTDTHLASAYLPTFIQCVGMSTTRWVSR